MFINSLYDREIETMCFFCEFMERKQINNDVVKEVIPRHSPRKYFFELKIKRKECLGITHQCKTAK